MVNGVTHRLKKSKHFTSILTSTYTPCLFLPLFLTTTVEGKRNDLGAEDEQLALQVLRDLKEPRLVQEHVETRTLYNPMQPKTPQVCC